MHRKDSAEYQLFYIKPDSILVYKKPQAFTFLKNIPGDFKTYYTTTFTRENLWNIGSMTVATVILVAADQDLLDGATELGKALHIAPTNSQRAYFSVSVPIGNHKIEIPLNGPWDVNSAMYYLGDGITHFSIAGGFWLYGKTKKDYRALQTASQLTECILTTGIATQFLKHITGRESPFVSTMPGGRWVFFPNQIDYHKHVPHYDAFPSGHIATAMATVTIIAENYPEYRFIRPVGYTLMGVLAFGMLNNGVHWMSDYPLGIALGYSFAKIALNRGRSIHVSKDTKQGILRKPEIYPVGSLKGIGLGLRWKL